MIVGLFVRKAALYVVGTLVLGLGATAGWQWWKSNNAGAQRAQCEARLIVCRANILVLEDSLAKQNRAARVLEEQTKRGSEEARKRAEDELSKTDPSDDDVGPDALNRWLDTQ